MTQKIAEEKKRAASSQVEAPSLRNVFLIDAGWGAPCLGDVSSARAVTNKVETSLAARCRFLAPLSTCCREGEGRD